MYPKKQCFYSKSSADVKFKSGLVQRKCIANKMTYGYTGAILVFLPGYDEIITLRDNLTADREFGNSRR